MNLNEIALTTFEPNMCRRLAAYFILIKYALLLYAYLVFAYLFSDRLTAVFILAICGSMKASSLMTLVRCSKILNRQLLPSEQNLLAIYCSFGILIMQVAINIFFEEPLVDFIIGTIVYSAISFFLLKSFFSKNISPLVQLNMDTKNPIKLRNFILEHSKLLSFFLKSENGKFSETEDPPERILKANNTQSKTCPRCRLISPASASCCDCGYKFY